MGRPPVEVDELVEHWTVLEDEQQLVAGKRGATRLGFALLLKFYMGSPTKVSLIAGTRRREKAVPPGYLVGWRPRHGRTGVAFEHRR